MPKIAKLVQNGWKPNWWLDTVLPWLSNRTPQPILDWYGELYWKLRGTNFTSVSDADWDNLLLLDACRYDIFADVHNLPGELEVRYSPAPQTPSFLRENFGDGTYHDTVYVTANPHVRTQLRDGQFHAVYHVWRSHWDEKLKTVKPEAMLEVARQVTSEHPKKRLIVHFMQPHLPFIGPWAREALPEQDGFERARRQALNQEKSRWSEDIYSMLDAGILDKDTVKRAYTENLEIALESVNHLISYLDGKTVVTSDHGEHLGDVAWPYPWREYGHPDLLTTTSSQIPWLEVETGKRKLVISEPPMDTLTEDESDRIEEKLRSLGYQ